MHKHTLNFMDYYIALPGKKRGGPYKKKDLIANGIKPDSLVWRQGLETWMAAKQVEDLRDLFVGTNKPALAIAPPPLPTPPPMPTSAMPETSPETITLQRELDESRREINELKASVAKLQKSSAKPVKSTTAKPIAKAKSSTSDDSKKKEKKAEKKKEKTKYDHPVCDWCNESIWLLVIVICHALMALFQWTTFEYIYLDIVGAVLSITGIAIGSKIKKLNKISYKKDSESRLKAEPLGHFNGILVSATAAVGFLIILVQSAHYVYVC